MADEPKGLTFQWRFLNFGQLHLQTPEAWVGCVWGAGQRQSVFPAPLK